jgi:hypothetical protein
MRFFRSLILICSCTIAFAQTDSVVSNHVYGILNACFAGANGGIEKMYYKPLVMPAFNDSILFRLAHSQKITTADIPYLRWQVNNTSISEWDKSRLINVKLIKRPARTKFLKNVYGASIPLVSRNGKLGIIYVRYLGSDMVHEEILVYEFDGARWQLLKSVYSLIGS